MDNDSKSKIEALMREMKGADPAIIMDAIDRTVGRPVNDETRLCACGYRVPLKSLGIVNTGVVEVVNNVCQKCIKDSQQVAHLCCTSCREVFVHVNPSEEKCGFRYEPGKYYHTTECPFCSSNEGGMVIEKILYYRKHNIPYKDGVAKKIEK